jgi:flagellar hook-associated protein 3 FlgL
MSNRISTNGFHSRATREMLAQQTKLSRTQTQVSTGKRIQSPADDPVATSRILDLQRAQSQNEQFAKNAISLRNRLQVGEQALSDVGSLLQRVRDLAVQANSAALDTGSRAAIATEVSARVQELQDIANRRDANGEYLFSGYSGQTRPFSRGGAGVAYAGDQGIRSLQISPDQKIADGFSGQRVFMDITQANGTFTTQLGVHTGTGSIDIGTVTNVAAWVPDTYTLRFVTPDTWEVVNSASTVVGTGAYTSGASITFSGVQVAVSGQPAAGDSFIIAPAGKESLFRSLDELVTTLRTAVDDPQSRARLNTEISSALAQIDAGLDVAINLRAEVGSRLSRIDAAEESRDSLDAELSLSLSELQDVDYAEAITRLNQQMVGLQAAQAAYTRMAQLSLFDYL